jgi:hypothetical protein
MCTENGTHASASDITIHRLAIRNIQTLILPVETTVNVVVRKDLILVPCGTSPKLNFIPVDVVPVSDIQTLIPCSNFDLTRRRQSPFSTAWVGARVDVHWGTVGISAFYIEAEGRLDGRLYCYRELGLGAYGAEESSEESESR